MRSLNVIGGCASLMLFNYGTGEPDAALRTDERKDQQRWE
jgi:hypothetical protein